MTQCDKLRGLLKEFGIPFKERWVKGSKKTVFMLDEAIDIVFDSEDNSTRIINLWNPCDEGWNPRDEDSH